MSECDDSIKCDHINCDDINCDEPATHFYQTELDDTDLVPTAISVPCCSIHKFDRKPWTALKPITREEFIAFQVMHS
jgi:hypothetical protein